MALFCLTGGGTFGHVGPNLVLADELHSRKNCRLIYIGSKGGIEKDFVSKVTYIQYREVTTGKLRRYLTWRNLLLPIEIGRGFWQALCILRVANPDVVFSSGGYVGVPVAIAAWFLRIPVVTYDADMTMGLANKILSLFSVCSLCNFEALAKKVMESNIGLRKLRRVLYVGPFIRKEFNNTYPERIREKLVLSKTLPILLVFGGSMGSTFLNQQIMSIRDQLLQHFQIIHVVGRGREIIVAPGYVGIEFVDSGDFPSYMALADVIVSRAGASSIFEIIHLRKPNVLIPLSRQYSRGDQEDNAAYLEALGASIVLREEQCNTNSLLVAIERANKERGRLLGAMNNIFPSDAAKKTADILIEIIGKRCKLAV